GDASRGNYIDSRFKLDVDVTQWQGMTEWNQFRRSFGCLDSSDLRRGENIALRDLIVGDRFDGLRLDLDSSGRNRHPRAQRFVRNINHSNATVCRNVTKLALHQPPIATMRRCG